MQKKHIVVIALSLVTTACTKDANGVLNSAQSSMGNPKSLIYSGKGMNAFFGQALTAGKEWPRRDLTSYTRTINYDAKSSREEMAFRNGLNLGSALRVHGPAHTSSRGRA